MRSLSVFLLLLAACGPAAAPPPVARAAAPALLRVVTWNVHDLFDELDRTLPPGDLDTVLTPAEVEAKLEAVAAVLRRLDADVVLLQEVEDAPLLGRLAARAGYPEARLVDGNDPRGIDVALLSRLPVLAYLSHAAERGADGRPLWPRDAVEAEVEVAAGEGGLAGAGRLVLAGTHLSSRLSDPDGARRRVQAAALRALADAAAARLPGALVLAGGDLNDPAGAPALAPLLGEGAWVDPLAGLPAWEGWTWSGGGLRDALDHLALPAGRADRVVAAFVDAGADAAGASDHRPVALDLRLP
ncbi:MAG TPA: endonuclease/exonuclease/phosphatase family protein [Anaeromyxobacteraceae bacterium]|nr:endonuclease/exonuclease/phosphatase family protein [Anaeromyxobacteraceae bacterium]